VEVEGFQEIELREEEKSQDGGIERQGETAGQDGPQEKDDIVDETVMKVN